MPIHNKSPWKPGLPEEKELREALSKEFREPQETGEPQIIIDRPYPTTIHLYVIWSIWNDLEQIVRSRVILDAFTEAQGETEAELVTVAMGLTPTEADRMGIKWDQ